MPRGSAPSSGSAPRWPRAGELVLSPLDALPGGRAPAPPQPARAGAPPAGAVRAPRVDTLARARAEADRGRLDAARALCLETLRERPLDADAHLLLAAVEEERGRSRRRDLGAAARDLHRARRRRRRTSGSVACCCARGAPTPAGAASPPPPRCSRRATPDALVDGLTAGEVLAAAKAAS